MNDEIKEMLDLINELVKISPNKGSYGISHKKWKQLLNYINNLQHQISLMEEDIRESKEINGELQQDIKNYVDIVLYQRKTIDNLQQENERLKENLQQEKKDFKEANDYCFELKDYKSRCKKTSEYFKYQLENLDFYEDTKARMLCAMGITLLQNGSDNQ